VGLEHGSDVNKYGGGVNDPATPVDLINMQMTLINMYIVLICKLITAQADGTKRRHLPGQ